MPSGIKYRCLLLYEPTQQPWMRHLSKPCGHGCSIWTNPVAMDAPFEPTLWQWMFHLSQPCGHGCSIWANPVAMDVPFEPTLLEAWMFQLSWHSCNTWTTWAKIQPWIVHMSQPSPYIHWIWANPTTMDVPFPLTQQPWMLFHLTQECSHGCSIWARPAAMDAPVQTFIVSHPIVLTIYKYVMESSHYFNKCSVIIDSSPPGQNCHHFVDMFKCIFLNENIWILNKTSLKYVPLGV